MSVSADIQDRLGEGTCALFRSGDLHDDLPKGQRKVNILEPRRLTEERRDFFKPSIVGMAYDFPCRPSPIPQTAPNIYSDIIDVFELHQDGVVNNPVVELDGVLSQG